MALSFAEYLERRPSVSSVSSEKSFVSSSDKGNIRRDDDYRRRRDSLSIAEATADDFEEVTHSPVLTSRGRRQRSKSWDERSRIDWARRQQAADRVKERHEESWSYEPRLNTTGQSRLFHSVKDHRREYWMAKEMEQCSFRPQVRRCPEWIATMADASRRRKDLKKDLHLHAYLRSVHDDYAKQLRLHPSSHKDLETRRESILRQTKRRGRPPSPPPPWRFNTSR